jgi:hypothetical protein
MGGPIGMVGSGSFESKGLYGFEHGNESKGRVPIPDEKGHLVYSSEELNNDGGLTLGGVVHEISHAVGQGHGPEFATNYLKNVHNHIHPQIALALEQHYIKNGIDYDPNWNDTNTDKP